MSKNYSWNISRYMLHGCETYGWVVREGAGKTLASGRESSRAAALLAAMKAIHQLEHPRRPTYE